MPTGRTIEPNDDDGTTDHTKLITLAAAAERLSVSVRTVRRLIGYGYLPGYRVGPRAIRVHIDDVDAAVRRLPEGYDEGATNDGPGDT
jgi:excisionase family DNA binding protein